jgi:hypothetical protein
MVGMVAVVGMVDTVGVPSEGWYNLMNKWNHVLMVN